MYLILKFLKNLRIKLKLKGAFAPPPPHFRDEEAVAWRNQVSRSHHKAPWQATRFPAFSHYCASSLHPKCLTLYLVLSCCHRCLITHPSFEFLPFYYGKFSNIKVKNIIEITPMCPSLSFYNYSHMTNPLLSVPIPSSRSCTDDFKANANIMEFHL